MFDCIYSMDARTLKEQLSKLRHTGVDPRGEWVAKNRAQLLNQIQNTLPTTIDVPLSERLWSGLSIFIPQGVVYSVVRPVSVFVIVALVATSAYSGTVKASMDTLPGDWLYPAKRATERTQGVVISLLGNDKEEVQYHFNLANRRATEAQTIIKKGDPEKVEKVVATVAELKQEMNTVNAKLEATKTGNTLSAEAVRDVMKDNAEQIKTVLQDIKNDLIISSSTVDKAISKEISESKDLLQDVSLKAVEVIVSKHLEGDTSVSPEEVKKTINTALTNVVNEVAESKQTVDGAKTIVETVKTEVKGLAGEIQKQNNVELTSSTKSFNQQIDTVIDKNNQAAKQAEAVSVEVGKKAEEARELLGNNDLAKAVDKIKEVSEATKEAEKIVVTTIKNTQTVLPLVSVIKDTMATGTPEIVSGTLKIVPLIITSTPAVKPVTGTVDAASSSKPKTS